MKNISKGIERLFTLRNQTVIIGLTGRTGSGCSTVADSLIQDVESFGLAIPKYHKVRTNEDRKEEIVYNYFKVNYNSFTKISVSDIIVSFILEHNFENFNNYIKDKFGYHLDKGLNARYDSIAAKLMNNKISKEIFKYTDDEIKTFYNFFFKELKPFSDELKKILKVDQQINYYKLFQKIGDNIRSSGNALSEEVDYNKIFTIAERIKHLIEVIQRMKGCHYFVVDAFRHPLEISYFKENFAGFYLFAIHRPNDKRIERLKESKISCRIEISKN
jgi:dephospho-CoA kinase